MRLASAPRWAISFADLALLLLGCFVMLHAMRANAPARAAEAAAIERGTVLTADSLFEQGEARLTAAGHRRLTGLAEGFRGRRLALLSRGQSEQGARLDSFELSAARSAAVARLLRDHGARDVSVAMVAGAEAGQNMIVSAES